MCVHKISLCLSKYSGAQNVFNSNKFSFNFSEYTESIKTCNLTGKSFSEAPFYSTSSVFYAGAA